MESTGSHKLVQMHSSEFLDSLLSESSPTSELLESRYSYVYLHVCLYACMYVSCQIKVGFLLQPEIFTY